MKAVHSQQLIDEVAALVRRLTALIELAPAPVLARVQGTIELTVMTLEGPLFWTLRVRQGRLVVQVGRAADPGLKLGFRRKALMWLLDGTLDVPRACREGRMGYCGSEELLARLAACFALPAGNALQLRLAG